MRLSIFILLLSVGFSSSNETSQQLEQVSEKTELYSGDLVLAANQACTAPLWGYCGTPGETCCNWTESHGDSGLFNNTSDWITWLDIQGSTDGTCDPGYLPGTFGLSTGGENGGDNGGGGETQSQTLSYFRFREESYNPPGTGESWENQNDFRSPCNNNACGGYATGSIEYSTKKFWRSDISQDCVDGCWYPGLNDCIATCNTVSCPVAEVEPGHNAACYGSTSGDYFVDPDRVTGGSSSCDNAFGEENGVIPAGEANVGGETGIAVGDTVCCGDDSFDGGTTWEATRTCSDSSAEGSGCTGTTVCCSYSTSCVDEDDLCRAAGSCHGSGIFGNSYCNAGSWEDPDESASYCDFSCDVTSGDDGIGYLSTYCCGNNAGEFFLSGSCCDALADCVDASGTCIDTTGSGDGGFGDGVDYCSGSPGSWQDCTGTGTDYCADGYWCSSNICINTCDDNSDCNGVCGGDNLNCVGCIYDTACNYDSLATIDNDSCVFAENGYDCEGNQLSIEEGVLPLKYEITDIFPNPFNPITTISFSIPQSGMVSLKVYDIQGREIYILKEGFMGVGYYNLNWDASSQQSGIYFVKMISGGYVEMKKVVLVK